MQFSNDDSESAQESCRSCIAPIGRALWRTAACADTTEYPSLHGFMAGTHTALGALVMVLPAAAAYRAGYEDALVLILTGSLGLGLIAAAYQVNKHGLLRRALRLSAIIAVPTISGLIVLKPAAVHLLYSEEFIDAVELLRWTLLGDYIRVAGWVLATTLIARADMRAYLTCEVVWNVLFAAIALWLVPGGIAGAGPAYLGAYAVYLIVLLWRVSTNQSISIRTRAIVQWFLGLAIVVLPSALTWHDTTIEWIKLCVLPIAAVYSWTIMSTTEKRFVRDWSVRWVARALKA